MKIVLYSGGQARSNHKLHRAVVELALQNRRKKTPLSMTYIPFCADGSSIFYHRIIRRFRAHGAKDFFCLNVDTSPTSHDIQKALKSDIIYLAGGNTFYFLKYLRKSGMLEHLKNFAKKGGVLAGLSAGALIMSPTVALAADIGLGPDPNEVGVKNYKGMGLFEFEFSPHFVRSKKQIDAHLAYSRLTPFPVYAVEDGSGMILNGTEFLMIGKGDVYYHGSRTILNAD